jgi:hypothetical protein
MNAFFVLGSATRSPCRDSAVMRAETVVLPPREGSVVTQLCTSTAPPGATMRRSATQTHISVARRWHGGHSVLSASAGGGRKREYRTAGPLSSRGAARPC